MKIKIEALVEPALLIWARESAGLDIQSVSRKIKVKPENIEQWEKGQLKLSIPQLKKLAHLYKRPFAVFYLPRPPKDFDALRDFRRLPQAAPLTYSPEFLFLIREVQEKREVFLELLEITDSETPKFEFTIERSSPPIQIASKIRQLLNISIEEQYSWKNIYDALNAWKIAIEKLGVLVFQNSGVSVDEMRGFSIYKEQHPIIVINAKDSVAGRIFTLIHEFVHLLIRQDGICNLEEEGSYKDIEVFCNALAGAVLVPREALKGQPSAKNISSPKDWTDEEIKTLADKFRVSGEVILRRLLIIKLTSQKFYEKKRADFLEYSIQAKGRIKKGGFLPIPNKVVRDFGKPYVQTVLNAYHSDVITASAVSDYLGVRLKHLSRIAVLGSDYEPRARIKV